MAAHHLGAHIIGMSGAEGTSVLKGEPFLDTLKMYEGMGAQLFIIRHPLAGSAQYAADALSFPVINAGDGRNGHPSQTSLDIVTIQEAKGTLDGLKVAFVGDLKYGRTVHSGLQACVPYEIEPWLVSPEMLQMPAWRIRDFERAAGRKPVITEDMREAIEKCDVLYMTRIQREWFPSGPEGDAEFTRVSGIYTLTAELLKDSGIIVLHPLPRYKHHLEVAMGVNKLPNAWFYTQAENGVYTRMVLERYADSNGFEGVQRLQDEGELWHDLPITHGTKSGERLHYRLDDGTLIDHIEAGVGERVIRILGLPEDTTIIAPRHIRSSQYGSKDVIAIPDKELTPHQLRKIGLVSPRATINIIRSGRVAKKGKVHLPHQVQNLVQCTNDNCISQPTHHEHVPSYFHIEERDPLLVRCHYCEQSYEREEIQLQK